MCDAGIVEGTMAAIQIGSTLLGASSQNKAARGNKKAALTDLTNQEHALSARDIQEKTAAGNLTQQANRDTLAAEGTTKAGASAAGVAGMSIDALLGTMEGENAAYRQSVNDNLVVSLDQIERMRTGAEAQARDRINRVQPANPLATGLAIAGSLTDFAKFQIGNKPKGS